MSGPILAPPARAPATRSEAEVVAEEADERGLGALPMGLMNGEVVHGGSYPPRELLKALPESVVR
jgi:hypothetical protein